MRWLRQRGGRTADLAPALAPAQARALAALREDGIAVTSFDELVADAALWDELAREMEAFSGEAEARVPREQDAPAAKDDYLIRRHGGERRKREGSPPPVLAADSPWLRLATAPAVLDVVNAYRGEPTRLVDLDQWYTVPYGGTHDRIASQRWHRDPEENHVVKTFVYFSDVDEEAGPFQYVRGSAGGGRYGDLWPWGQGKNYPSQEKLAAKVPAEDILTLTGERGTVILCDTSGFHRGGFARSRPRVLSYHTYVSAAADFDRRFAVAEAPDPEVSEAARFALA